MSYPGAITYEEARSFADFVREAVLRYSAVSYTHLANTRRNIYDLSNTVETNYGGLVDEEGFPRRMIEWDLDVYKRQTSCLDKYPGSSIPEKEAMRTFADAEQTLTGIYASLKSNALYSG